MGKTRNAVKAFLSNIVGFRQDLLFLIVYILRSLCLFFKLQEFPLELQILEEGKGMRMG